MIDEKGYLVAGYNYSPFGITEMLGEASENPFKYTGREDDGTGLYYYRARYYSPEMGRFISEDPIRFAGGDVNWYAYVNNSPLNFVDPLGLWRRNVHYGLTYELALKAGFSRREAHIIASANQGLDDSIFTSPWNPLGGSQRHFKSPADAREVCRTAIDEGDLSDLGKALHELQDTYSHYSQGYRWYTGGHIRDGHDPDIAYMNSNFVNMRNATSGVLNEYRERHY